MSKVIENKIINKKIIYVEKKDFGFRIFINQNEAIDLLGASFDKDYFIYDSDWIYKKTKQKLTYYQFRNKSKVSLNRLFKNSNYELELRDLNFLATNFLK